MLAPIPTNEASRLESLVQYEILDTPPEAYFDEIAQLASYVCGTTSAVITLIDSRRQWFKSRVAFVPVETPRELAFCAHTIMSDDVFVVPDALLDPRFADNPLVTGPPQIRFYAGAPLVTSEGHAIGSLAVIDYAPRVLDDRQKHALRSLSHQVVAQFELRRRHLRERRFLQERTDHTEAEKRALVESSMDAIVAINHLGHVIEFNPAAETMFGHARADVVGQKMVDLIVPPALRDDHHRGFAHCLATGEGRMLNRRLETTALRADLTEFPVELTLVRLRESSPPAFAAFIRDLTERRQAELALRRSTERFQLVARAINDAVWDWDLATDTIWWSDGLRTMFRLPTEALAHGREGWRDRLHPDDVERVQQSLREVIAGDGEFWCCEYRFRRQDGTYAEVMDRGYVVRADAKRVRMLGALMDVTDQKLAQQQIQQSELRYRELIDGIRDAIFTISRDGVVRSANRASELILGWPRHDWIGRAFLPRVHPDDRGVAAQTFDRVLRGEAPAVFELRLTTSSGATVVMELTVSPQHAGDQIVGVLGVARDITERHRLEVQLRQAQKMEALGHLSGGVAHDFNNLLTIIQCNAMLLTEGVDPEEVTERAREILEASERAAGLTRQLLLLSRKQAMRPTVVDVNAVVRDMTKMLRRVLGEDVSLRPTYGVGLLVRADVGMLEQVLLNLAVNARDAMPGGGDLSIVTGETRVHAPPGHPDHEVSLGRYVWISVTDTGGGIAPDVLPHIFEPFYTTKEVGRGTGLGLATAYAIVRQHRGWIEVSSAVGRGTTFRIHLPASDAELPARSGERAGVAPRLPTGTETILLVEDETAVRLLVVTLLEHCGYTVLQARTGVEALEVWQREHQRIRLVLTDLIMPGGLNGREVAARIRAEAPHLPVVYTSGYSADLAGQGEPLVAGSNFLAKPYSPGELTAIVRANLDGHR